MDIRRAPQNCMALNLKSKLALVLFTISLSYTVGHSDKCSLLLNLGILKAKPHALLTSHSTAVVLSPDCRNKRRNLTHVRCTSGTGWCKHSPGDYNVQCRLRTSWELYFEKYSFSIEASSRWFLFHTCMHAHTHASTCAHTHKHRI